MQPRRHPFQTTSTKASRPNLITRGKPSTAVWRTPPLDISVNHAGYPNTQPAGLAQVTHRNQESKIRCSPADTPSKLHQQKASRPNLITRGKPSTVVWRTPPLDISVYPIPDATPHTPSKLHQRKPRAHTHRNITPKHEILSRASVANTQYNRETHLQLRHADGAI